MNTKLKYFLGFTVLILSVSMLFGGSVHATYDYVSISIIEKEDLLDYVKDNYINHTITLTLNLNISLTFEGIPTMKGVDCVYPDIYLKSNTSAYTDYTMRLVIDCAYGVDFLVPESQQYFRTLHIGFDVGNFIFNIRGPHVSESKYLALTVVNSTYFTHEILADAFI